MPNEIEIKVRHDLEQASKMSGFVVSSLQGAAASENVLLGQMAIDLLKEAVSLRTRLDRLQALVSMESERQAAVSDDDVASSPSL